MYKVLVAAVVIGAALTIAGAALAAPAGVDCGKISPAKVVTVNCAGVDNTQARPYRVDTQKPNVTYCPERPRGSTGFFAHLQKDIQELISWAAQKVGLAPALLSAVARAESGGNQAAVSPKGAVGVMQLMPGTARGLGVNPYNPQENVLGGAIYLKRQLDKYQGDIPKALAAYNAGPGAVDKYNGVPPYRETITFVSRVMSMIRGDIR